MGASQSLPGYCGKQKHFSLAEIWTTAVQPTTTQTKSSQLHFPISNGRQICCTSEHAEHRWLFFHKVAWSMCDITSEMFSTGNNNQHFMNVILKAFLIWKYTIFQSHQLHYHISFHNMYNMFWSQGPSSGPRTVGYTSLNFNIMTYTPLAMEWLWETQQNNEFC
jgi:hypothetical protein